MNIGSFGSLITRSARHWVIVVMFLLLGLLSAGISTLLQTPQYTATTSLYIAAQNPSDTTVGAYQGSLLSEQKVKSYTELAQSREVAVRAIRGGQLQIDPEALSRRITVSSDVDSVVLNVSATAATGELAASYANSVAQVFTQYVGELEQPLDQAQPPSVVVRIVDAALPSTDPSSPNWPLNLSIGLLAGMLVGVGVAFLRQSFDTSVRSEESMVSITERPNLGLIPAIRGGNSGTSNDVLTGVGDAYRQIRTNLQFMSVDSSQSTIVITSANASEGKTMSALELAYTMGAAGRRVLLVDADLRRPALATRAGVEASVGLTSILIGRAKAAEVTQPIRDNVKLIASGPVPPNPSELLGSGRMAEFLSEMEKLYDAIILDCAPILPVADTLALVGRLDNVLLVVRYGSTTTAHLEATVRRLSQVSGTLLGTILNMVPRAERERYGQLDRYYSATPVSSAASPESDQSVSYNPNGTRSKHDIDDSEMTRPHPFPGRS